MPDALPELCALALRHAGAPPPLAGVTLWRAYRPTEPVPAIYEPMLYFPLQGTKRLISGDRVLQYGAGSFVLGALDAPVIGEVIEAAPDRPYLAVAIALDIAKIAALLLDVRGQPPDGSAAEGQRGVNDVPAVAASTEEAESFAITPTTDAMHDALLRLLRLFDAPADVPLLQPMIERELLYRVLQGPRGFVLRQLARSDSRISQIQRAIKWIRAHLAEPLSIDQLAAIASMSVSSFHRHFKAVTGHSPLAFHKQLRLQEARLRLLAAPDAVATVAFAVGYESASQFSREYARQFGIPPGKDAARLRAT